MSDIKDDRKYTKDHEWALANGDELKIGITDYAQHSLGDIVFVEVNTTGNELKAGETFGTIESVKAAEDLYMPVTGTISSSNEDLFSQPEKINSEPYESWLITVKGYNKSEYDGLMDAAAYKEFVGSLD